MTIKYKPKILVFIIQLILANMWYVLSLRELFFQFGEAI